MSETLLLPEIDEAPLVAFNEFSLPALNLPDSDGEPMENERERFQITLLLEILYHGWRGRQDFYAAGNMFLYYSLEQGRQIIEEVIKRSRPPRAFRGPDVFIVLNVDGSFRRQKWVVWEEGGRYPDVIFEFFSPSTEQADRTTKKTLYEQTFRTPEYYWFDPFRPSVFQGWHLDSRGQYQPATPDERGWLWSPKLQLWIGRWQGTYMRDRAVWLRFYDADGQLVPTPAEAERNRVAVERARANTERARAEAEHTQAEAA
ncbi:MAG: Uma2 family endonuclease, partial [Chloroflexota bacterium]